MIWAILALLTIVVVIGVGISEMLTPDDYEPKPRPVSPRRLRSMHIVEPDDGEVTVIRQK